MPPTKLVDCSVPFYSPRFLDSLKCHQRSWWIVQFLSTARVHRKSLKCHQRSWWIVQFLSTASVHRKSLKCHQRSWWIVQFLSNVLSLKLRLQQGDAGQVLLSNFVDKSWTSARTQRQDIANFISCRQKKFCSKSEVYRRAARFHRTSKTGNRKDLKHPPTSLVAFKKLPVALFCRADLNHPPTSLVAFKNSVALVVNSNVAL
jgi:hypothetical protein